MWARVKIKLLALVIGVGKVNLVILLVLNLVSPTAKLQACLDRILQYSLSKRDGRLSRDTFPGLMTMHDYGPLRIAVLGRPGVGRSHTANNILELLGEDPTEGVSAKLLF